MQIKIKKVNDGATLPNYAYNGDAGADLFSCEETIINPGKRVVVNTGVAMAIPDGYVGVIWDKSGLAVKHGIHTMAGVIDSNYRGEIKIVLKNLGDEDFVVNKGMKIAQILIKKVEMPEFLEVEELNESDRGEQGFGSSGV